MTKVKLTKYQAATLIAGIGAVALVAFYALGSPELRAMMESRLEWLIAMVVAPYVQAFFTKDTDGDGTPDVFDDTPNGPPPAGGAALLVLALVLSAVTQGCGAGALGAQADLVAMGGIAAARADEAIIAARAADLDEVVEQAEEECGTAGCAEDRAAYYRAELERRTEAWAAPLACRVPVVEALRSWLDGLRTAQAVATDEVGLELLAVLGGRFVAAYAAAGACVEGAGGPRLPGLDGALGLIGGAS